MSPMKCHLRPMTEWPESSTPPVECGLSANISFLDVDRGGKGDFSSRRCKVHILSQLVAPYDMPRLSFDSTPVRLSRFNWELKICDGKLLGLFNWKSGPYLVAQDPKTDLNTKAGFHFTFYNPRWFFLSLGVAVARLQGLCKGLEKRTERI
ncbi:hypothetical protein VNO80_23303 [Phaseolus coccineus]|uniref:Uncharacterized protein n=1 Tax=Phaseolus coccineus TaxID=3886 RepID=A0AAN9MBB6_PHACN